MQNDCQKFVLALTCMVLLAGVGCRREAAPTLSYNKSSAEEIRRILQQSQKAQGGAGAVATAEPDGWATLKGKFTLNGTPPPRPPLTVDKDMSVCAAAGKQTLAESVVVGPDKGIKNVIVFLNTAIPNDSKWLHESYAASKESEVLFDQKECIFLSHVAGMWFEQKLKVINSDPVGHNTNLDSKSGSVPANVIVPANTSTIYEPKKPSPAPFPVSCNIHPWMNAWVMACRTPHFAVTADDGSFEIKYVPSGVPLEFRVWQEKANFLQAVTVNGQAQKWNRGRVPLTLAKDEQKELNVVVEAAVFQ